MRKFFKLLWVALAVGLGIWLWGALFPSPEKVVRTRLKEIEELVSFPPNEKPFTALTAVQQLCARLSPHVEVEMDAPGMGQHKLRGREEVRYQAGLFRSQVNGAKVEFLDVNVAVASDKQSAETSLTVKARVSSEPDTIYQEMKLTFRKLDGKWLLARAETVKTLR